MKTCKNGREEGRGGKVKCPRSPLQSCLRFVSHILFFPYFFSPKSTHFSSARLFLFSLLLFCLILSTFNPPTHSRCSILFSLFFPPPSQTPSADLVRVVWFQHRSRGAGGAGAFSCVTLQHDIGRSIFALSHSRKRVRVRMFHKVEAAPRHLT